MGEAYVLPSRTLTDAHFSAFQALSLDNHPIHYDVEYCRERGYPGVLAHGLQIFCFTAAGAGAFPHEIGDVLIGMVEARAKLKRGAFPGDTLRPRLEIVELIRQRTTGVVVMSVEVRNQRHEIVLEGEHRYLLRLR